MINLLSNAPSKEELADIFARHPPRSPLPRFGEPRWSAAFSTPFSAPFLAEITRRALAEALPPLPYLTDALYRDYATTGIRLHFEGPYFERRRRFARAAIALLTAREPLKPLLLQTFLDKLEALFAEVSWALPAHVTDSTGRDPRVLDLFGAETANLMAECLHVFAALIPSDLHSRIRTRLRRDYFENYRDNDIWWCHVTHNWNAVCHQGILGAALAVETDSALLAALFDKARVHLPKFLDGFGDDGACSEGPSYWDYGFGWFAMLNEQLETRTRGELSLFAGNEKIRAIAGYGPAVSLRGGRLINFADCDPKCALRPSTLAYLGDSLDHAGCRHQAAENYARLAREGADYDAERSDFFFWSRFFLHAPKEMPSAGPARRDVYFPSLGIWSVSGTDREGHVWELAAKAGSNAEHHNHNDIGSFILNVDGIPLVTEIGMPEYTGAYFDPLQRYEHLAARTLGHSLPIINGCEQATGPDFTGAVVFADLNTPVTVFEVDLTHAYPLAARCRLFIRRIILDKTTGTVRWQDLITLNEPGRVEAAVITDSDSVALVSPKIARITKSGLSLELSIAAAAPATWSRVETHAYTAHDGHPANCRRLVFTDDETAADHVSEITLALSNSV